MVCAYLSKEVAQIHGSAQVAGQTIRRKRRQIYSADSSGSGQGRLGNRGHGRCMRIWKEVMGYAAEVVAGVIEIAEECPTSMALIYPTPLAHLPTNNGPRLVQAVGEPMSLSNA